MLSEIGDTSAPMSTEILEHKRKLRLYIKSFIEQALQERPADEIDVISDAIYLLFEGAIVESKIYKETWPVKKAKKMIRILVEEK